MSSFVYYKFKSQKEPQRVTIDGPHTDVWNLKREIINHARLGDGTDFDLKIYKENSNEEYTDDTEIIPKDSTVLARRLPAAAPGKGRAARYVSGKPPISAKPTAPTKTGKGVDMASAMTEEDRFKAMLKLTDAQWQQKQEEMSHETRVPLQGGKGFQKKTVVPEGEPPHGYICYRCGKKGHWIQACPTNDDATFDHKNRIKRTTGIPRSMLKKIDQADIENLDETQRQNLMVNADGEYVFAQADEKAWKRHLEQVKAAEAAKKNVTVGNQELREKGLECPIDKRLFVDPMKTPCCGKTYCHNCIENALLENDLTCPGCETENISLERLEPDEETKSKIKEYEADKKTVKSPAASAAADSVKDEQSESGSRPTSRDGGSRSPGSVDTTGQSKKRRAEEANTDSTDKLAPPNMKRQKSGESVTILSPTDQKSTPQANAGGNNGMNMNMNMPMPMSMPNMNMNMNMPDMASMMQNMPMNFPMMPFMPGMMPNNMMGMNGMGMNGMGMMPNMNFMPNFNMMGGMFPNGNPNGDFNPMNGFNGQNNHYNNGQGYNNGHQNGYNKHNQSRNFNHNKPHQAAGMPGVPTGPKSMQTQIQAPTGPANKFSNQQRPTGNEEDNAYMRQPVNPHRAYNKGKGKMRQADYREL